jgi:hypothetical protein
MIEKRLKRKRRGSLGKIPRKTLGSLKVKTKHLGASS